ncbi:MAG: hypothetical protein L0Z53_19895 [Acidobacteriales bacterium]|nr:hypothetical protein [Terriglobales bacterium]
MKLVAAFLVLLGIAQMVGDLAGLAPLKGVAAATGASPAPKVFSTVRGLETYSTRFYIEWTDARGAEHSKLITPAIYQRLAGPYNRRNVYGAVLAYGPVLVSDARSLPMFQSVSRYAMCREAPLLKELGFSPAEMRDVRVRLEPLSSTRVNLPLLLSPECTSD